jgi:hypothetical protein
MPNASAPLIVNDIIPANVSNGLKPASINDTEVLALAVIPSKETALVVVILGNKGNTDDITNSKTIIKIIAIYHIIIHHLQ